jgi:hypothetical protein
MVLCICNPSTQEVESEDGGIEVTLDNIVR